LINLSKETGAAIGHNIPLQMIIILATGVFAWSNSFNSPFVFDDLTAIVNNPLIRNLHGLLTDPSIFISTSRRFLGYLTFALNYRVSGLNTTGYHAINLALHLTTATLLLALCTVLERSRLNNDKAFQDTTFSFPLAAALLFVSHPVQTQAVTYITQRFSILAALFYTLALLCYAKARGKGDSGRNSLNGWYAASFLAATLSMFSKEISFSLPMAVLLLEIYLFKATIRQRLALLAPFAAMLAIPLLTLFFATDPELILASGFAASGTPAPTHMNYMITQSAVFSTYLRLLLLPVNQTLDYDYPVYDSITALPVVAGILLFLTMTWLAVKLYQRGDRGSRLAGFGICWFMVSLSVEAFVPLSDLINEHRLYLPSIGAAMAVSATLQSLSARVNPRIIKMSLIFAVIVLAAATWKRNLIWSDELLLWSDAVSKAPGKARPHYNLGTILSKKGLTEAAEQEFNTALAIDPAHGGARYNLGVLSAAKGDLVKAREDYEAAIRIDPTLAEAHNSLGVLLSTEGRMDEAIKCYRQALRISPLLADARNNLGAAVAARGDIKAALVEFEEAVRLAPDNRSYRENMDRALKLQNSKKL
jgi:tetratricopeptide (TPR) repeat protein